MLITEAIGINTYLKVCQNNKILCILLYHLSYLTSGNYLFISLHLFAFYKSVSFLFWIYLFLLFKYVIPRQVYFPCLIFQFPLVRFPHFFIIAKYIFCIFENDTDILWELFFYQGTWQAQWMFTYRWKTRGFEGSLVDSWLFLENAVMCYMISGDFLKWISSHNEFDKENTYECGP